MPRPQVTSLRVAYRSCSSCAPVFQIRQRSMVTILLMLPAFLLMFISIARLKSTRTNDQLFESTDSGGSKDFLCLFTTFKPKDSKMQIYKNVLYNWISLASERGHVRCILYDTTLSAINRNDTVQASTYEGHKYRPLVLQKLVDMAVMIGWDVVVLPRVSPYDGLPYFKDMYFETAKRFPMCKFSTFVNADIMFGDGLIPTLLAVEKVIGRFNQTLLLTGRRTNVDMDSLSRVVFSPKEVDRIASRGHMMPGYAQDYFFLYRNAFPWHVVPNIVVGRVAYDNFIVAKAYQTNVSVVDITWTAVAVHQSTSKDGDERGSRSHAHINNAVIGPFNYNNGLTDDAPFWTEKEKNANSSAVNVYQHCGRGCRRQV